MLKTRARHVALLAVLGGLGLIACKEESTTTPPATNDVATTVTQPTPAPAEEPAPAPKASPDARAKALGYARYLPKETQAFVGVYDGKGFYDGIVGSKLGKFLVERASEEGVELDNLADDPNLGMALPIFAEELFVALGDGADVQLNNLVLLGESSSRLQMKMLVKMMEAELTDEEVPGGMNTMMLPLVGGFMEDPQAGLAILEKSEVPPVTIGFKMSDDESREGIVGMIAGTFQQMLQGGGPDGEGVLEPLSVERGAAKFSGFRVLGTKIAEMMESEREDMADVFDPATIERLIKTVSEKNIVVMHGEHDGYVVLFVGSDVEQLQVAATPADSMVANPEMAFIDAYVDKKLLYVNAASKALLNGLAKNSSVLGSTAAGLKEGLEESEAFGDTRDMGVLLDLLIKQEKALLGLTNYSNMGVVVYREDGLKIETYGGTDAPSSVLDVPHTYGSLADREGMFLFSNWISDEEYSGKTMEYLDTLGEIAYLGAKRLSGLEIEDPDFGQFREGFGMFDQMFKADLMKLWKGIRGDLGAGLGGEGALIVDMEGGLPTVPGIPQVVADNGKAPRIGMVKPVTDRARISDSWKNINEAAEGLLKTVSQMTGENIPMQKPMTSEKDDLTTWFFASIPFQTDDFVLSVSVDEKNFFISTSKSFVQDLSAQLDEAKPDPARMGAYLTVDFGVLRDYANGWIDMVEENAEDITGSPDGAEQLKAMLPEVREAVGAMDELQSFQSHARNEDGRVRISMHLEVR